MKTTSYLIENFWSEHFSPIILVLSAFYLFSDSYWFIFAFQGFSLGLAAIPLYLIGEKLLKNSAAAAFIAIAYLLNGKLATGALFDYHMVSHIGIFALSAFYAMLVRRWGLYFLFGFLLMIGKEDFFLIFAMLGFYAAFGMRAYKMSAITFLVAGLYAIFVFKGAIPYFKSLSPEVQGAGRDGYWFLSSYMWLGDSVTEIAKNFLTKPVEMAKLVFSVPARTEAWITFSTSFGWTPFLSPLGLLMIAPPTAELLLNDYPARYTLLWHYPLMVVSLWSLATIMGVANIKRFLNYVVKEKNASRVVTGVTVVIVLLSLLSARPDGAIPGWSDLTKYYDQKNISHAANGDAVLAKIPHGSSLLASQGPFTKLHHNENTYLYMGRNKLDRGGYDPNYILIDTEPLEGFPISWKVLRRDILYFMYHPEYNLAAQKGSFFLFEKIDESFIVLSTKQKGWWPPVIMPGETGVDVANEEAFGGFAREAKTGRDKKGMMVFGPYLTLAKGANEASFKLKGHAISPDMPIATIEIATKKGQEIVATKTLLASDLNLSGEWSEFSLNFETEDEITPDIELRVIYLGGDVTVGGLGLTVATKQDEQ